MKKVLALILVASFLTTGCTGSFNLTKKVYNFHREKQPDKWADELCFLVVWIVPVYGIATFADAIIFNSIEFWTGENPVVLNTTDSQIKSARNGKDEVLLSYNPATDEISIVSSQNKKQPLTLERFNDGSVSIKNAKGEVLYISKKNSNGDISIYDRNDQLVKNFTAEDVRMVKESYARN
jgi:hypothetical protein